MTAILGIWDLQAAPLSLGGLLILAEELQMQRIIHGASDVDVCIVGDTSQVLPAGGRHSSVLSVLEGLEGISNYYCYDSFGTLGKVFAEEPGRYIAWPGIGERERKDYKYANTLFSQEFYLKRGFIPYLSCKNVALKWAADFVRRHAGQQLPVVVHLKNNPNVSGHSNADMKAWGEFFVACHHQYDAKFILVGSDNVDAQVSELANVVMAQRLGSNLVRDLALIQTSFMFMGMASGPCNAAIFSQVPYIIYKNPDHDVAEMELELGDRTRFPFSTPFQKLVRVRETAENLMAEFSDVHDQLNRSGREARIASRT